MNVLLKVIFIHFLCIMHNKLIFSMNWTEDNPLPDGDEKESIEPTRCPDEFQDFCHKNSRSLENLFRVFFNKKHRTTNLLSKNKRFSILPSHDSSNVGPCQCGMTFQPIDLGSSSFPRIFHTGVCKKNACGIFHRCQPRKYKVRILKRKETDTEPNTEIQEMYESVFPESLQENWVPDFVNIVVGCECLPKKNVI